MWDYFVINVADESKVSCHLCSAEVPRGGKDVKSFNTSNMRRYLEVKHPEEFVGLQVNKRNETRVVALLIDQVISQQSQSHL